MDKSSKNTPSFFYDEEDRRGFREYLKEKMYWEVIRGAFSKEDKDERDKS